MHQSEMLATHFKGVRAKSKINIDQKRDEKVTTAAE